MIKKILIAMLICSLMLSFSSCAHEHIWNDATLDTPKTCTKCDETMGSTIREMLIGDWREDGTSSIFLCVEFTETGFNGNIVISGEKTSTLSSKGTYSLSENVLTLTDSQGKTYIYYTIEIENDTIRLYDNEGSEWVKTIL